MTMHVLPTLHRGAATALLMLALAACSQDPTGVDSADPCVPREISMGNSVNGSLATDGCRRGGNLVARWVFDLAQEMDVRIDLTSSTIDPYLELQTASGAIIAANDDFGSLNSTIIIHLSAGRYIIQARDLGGGPGSFRLSLRVGPDCSPLGELQVGQTQNETLSSSDCIWETGGHSDNWTFTLGARTNLRFRARSPDFDEVVLIRDSDGQIMDGADEYGPTGFAQLHMQLPAGQWTITVGALTPGRMGAYDITVDHAPPCTPGTELVLGATESGSIDGDDCFFEGFAPADSFALVLDRETPLDFHMKSSEVRPSVVVRDANGNDITYADDVNGTGSARNQATLVAGSYAVYAFTFDYPQSGAYQLTVSEITCGDPTPIAFGSSEVGVLGNDDCLRANGAWQESWSLQLATDETVRIDMTSDEVDAYLILEDSAGNVITVDDDGGDGVNARIQIDLTAGRYGIVASSFGPGQEGSYALGVGAPPAPPLSPSRSSTDAAEAMAVKSVESGSPGRLRESLDQFRSRVMPDWLTRGK